MRNGSYVVDDSFKRKKGPQVHFMNPVQASLVNIRVRVRPVNSRFGEGCGKGREVGRDEGERGTVRGAFLRWQQMTNQLFWFYK